MDILFADIRRNFLIFKLFSSVYFILLIILTDEFWVKFYKIETVQNWVKIEFPKLSNFAIKSSIEYIVKRTSGSSATFHATRLLLPVLLNRVASPLQPAMHFCARLYLKARRYSSPSGWSIINYTSHHQNSGKNKDRRRKMAVRRFQRLDPVHFFVTDRWNIYYVL